MSRIPDTDMDVFQRASIPVIDNFTDSELLEISGIAQKLKAIMNAALKRQQDHLKAMGQG